MDDKARQCFELHAQMQSQRSTFNEVYRSIDSFINPSNQDFDGEESNKTKGMQRNKGVYDATPGLAMDRFKAALHSLITPRSQMWHLLQCGDEELSEDGEVKRYLEEVNKILFAARYATNFDAQIQMAYYSGGKYGSMALYIGERPGRSLYYMVVPMKQLYFAENEYGEIDTVHRDFVFTARQAMQKWGDNNSDAVKRAAERLPLAEFGFLHVVRPRNDRKDDRLDYQGMAFESLYYCKTSRKLLEQGGFRVFPYAVGRYDLNPGEVYGRSPCMTIMPDVRMLNGMNKTTMQAAQLSVLPPMLAHKNGVLDAIRLTPGAINYGGVDENGRQLIQPIQTGANPNVSLELMDQKRMVINDALLQTLFQILVDKPNITATEAMLRAQEKGQLVGPTGSRIESEMLSPMVHRELDILSRAGQLPEMPQKLIDAGGIYEVKFDSPLSRARESESGVAILRTFEQLAPIAQISGPEVFKRFNISAVSKELARLNGMPEKCLYTDDEMEGIDQATAQQNQMAQILEAAPVAADAAKNIAQAQAIAAASPSQVLPQVAG